MDSTYTERPRRTPQAGFRLKPATVDLLVLHSAANGVTMTATVEAAIAAYCSPRKPAVRRSLGKAA